MTTITKRLMALLLLCAPTTAFAETLQTDLTEDAWNGREVTLAGTARVHLTGDVPLTSCRVNLTGENAWLYLDAVKPTRTVSDYLSQITVDGAPADIATNVRIAEYGAGTVLIPNGLEVCKRALTVYTGENFSGESRTVAIQDPLTDLGAFDNNIRSIKLRQGFIATIANNPDGTGYSRCFIASDGDLEIPVLPEGFVTKDNTGRSFISYIRVMKWQWVSKKGWSGSDQGQMDRLNVTHYYGWDAGGPTDRIDREYVPHRHHIGWPGFDQIKSRDNVSHVLGHNEPDNTGDVKEHPASPLQIIREWPEFMRTGLRAGSPAPTGIWGNWLKGFFDLADSLNYRVDFVVFHKYEHTSNFASGVNKAVEVSKGRPVWITEWNNGANWTTNNENDWPDKTGPKCDADGVAADGAETVTLPATIANQKVQLEYMKQALANIDACDKLERTNFYTWVQDARSVELNGKKTLAGEYFAAHRSKVGFSKANEFEHVWKIAPPLPLMGYSEDFKKARVTWYDHNGETGKSYTVYRRDDDSKTYNAIKTLELGKDYQAGETVVFEDPILCTTRYRYRVRATSYNDEESINSRTLVVYRDNDVEAADVRCSATDPTTVRVEWSEVEGARGYRLERRVVSPAAEAEQEFKTVVASTESNSYSDNTLAEKHVYAYRVAVLSNADNTPVSEPVEITTPSLDAAPEGVFGLFAASGDGKTNIVWDKTYRTSWVVERADSEDGPWKTVSESLGSPGYEDADVQNGFDYYYRVLPDRLGRKGAYSKVIKASPAAGNFIFFPFDEGKFSEATDIFSGLKAGLSKGAVWTADRKGRARKAVALRPGKEACITLPAGIMRNVGDFTISLWVKPGQTGGRIFDFGSGTSKFMILNYTSGQFRYKLTDGAKTVDRNNIPCALAAGEWSHIALTQSGSIVKLYVNGKEIASISDAPAPSIMGKTTDNFLGKSQWSNDPHPDFSYDDFRILNRASTPEEVKEIMEQDNSSAVKEISVETPVKTEFFGIDGLRIENPAPGTLVIERALMPDGTVRTAKRTCR